ncbi:MAG: S8 family serine peptidase [Ignavibacteriaceae bacterium]
MNKLIKISILIFTIIYSYPLFSQEFSLSSKSAIEKGKITIKIKEGANRLYKKNSNTFSFGISSLDQKMNKYKVFSLKKRFNHKPIAKNSGLPDLSRIYQIEFPADLDISTVVNEFSTDPNVEYAEPVPVYYLFGGPNDTLYSKQRYLKNIQAEQAWDIHKGEDGDSTITLAIIDGGCKYDHPDLAQNIWNNLGEDADGDGKTFELINSKWVLDPDDINNIDDDGNGYIDDLIGWNFENYNNNPTDKDPYFIEGHGTVVAGIAAAVTNNRIGIASISYNLKLMPVNGWYDGIIYAAENGADIINCSWGGFQFSKADKEVIDYASGLGSIIVVAAGNDNSSAIFYPQGYPSVISVAGVDAQDVRASYSNFGPSIDVAAPIASISTSKNNYYTESIAGTSVCAPIVAGLAGLIKSFHPDWTNEQIVKQLIITSDDITAVNPNFEHSLGTGRVNAYRALAESNPAITPELKLSTSLLQVLQPVNPDSAISLSLRVQNHSHFLDANPLTITLTSDNPDVQIIKGNYTGLLQANSIAELTDIFQIKFALGASSVAAAFKCSISADLPVVAGSVFEFVLPVYTNTPLMLNSYNVTRIDSNRIYLHDISITNKGQPEQSSLSVQVKSLDSCTVAEEHKLIWGGINSLETVKMPGGYFFDISKCSSDSLKLILEISNGISSWFSQISIKIPPLSGINGLTTVMLDEANNLDNWTSSSWGITGQKYVSLPSSFTDSPGGYSAGSSSLDYKNPLKSLNAILAFIEFDSQWDIYNIGNNPDYGQVQLSTNNGFTWIPLPGRYSSLLTKNAPVYNGRQYSWIHEIVDVSDYLNYQLKFRFYLASPSMYHLDGLYIDNIKLSVYASQIGEQPYLDKAFARKNQDSVWFRIKFTNFYDHTFTPRLVYANLESTEKDSLMLYDDGLHGDSLANDNIYGNYIPPIPDEGIYKVGISTIDNNINNYIYTPNIYRFTTAGPLSVDSISYTKLSLVRYNIKPYIRNHGSTSTITKVNINILCDDPWVLPASRIMSFPDVPPDSLVGLTDWVRIQCNPQFPGYFNLKFEIISDGWTYWTDSVRLVVSTVGIDEQANLQLTFNLEQNYPNPFNPITKIKYSIPKQSYVTLIIYNILGREVTMLVNEEKSAGDYEATWDAKNFASGVYFYKIIAGDFVQVKKMVLLK